MILNEQEIVKIAYHIYAKYNDDSSILIDSVSVVIGDYIKIAAIGTIKGVKTEVNILCSTNVEKDTVIVLPKGVVKYGFLKFDICPFIARYTKELEWISVTDNSIHIKNPYIKQITYGNGSIEFIMS